jgi:hypothetical protein
MRISTIRPGLLVSLKTSLQGNVSYQTRDIEADHIDADGSRRGAWETQRTIKDAAEHERAVKVRSKARSLITGICAPSTFGLLCPESERDKLDMAISEARELAQAFNSGANLSQITVNVIVGRVASDDIEAVRAINSEIRDLLDAMESGLKRLDVDAVRKAANSARALGAMLSPEAERRTQAAIEAARTAARRIVKAGESAANAVDEATLRTIRTARTAFLDMDDATDMQAPSVSGRAIDLFAEPIALAAAPGVAAAAMEF